MAPFICIERRHVCRRILSIFKAASNTIESSKNNERIVTSPPPPNQQLIRKFGPVSPIRGMPSFLLPTCVESVPNRSRLTTVPRAGPCPIAAASFEHLGTKQPRHPDPGAPPPKRSRGGGAASARCSTCDRAARRGAKWAIASGRRRRRRRHHHHHHRRRDADPAGRGRCPHPPPSR